MARPKAPVAPGSPITVIKNRNARAQLAAACAEIVENNSMISALKKRNDELRTKEVIPIIEGLETNKVLGEGWQTIRTEKKTTKIVPRLLVEQGVTLEQIQKATETKTKPSYRVCALGDDSGDDEGDE